MGESNGIVSIKRGMNCDKHVGEHVQFQKERKSYFRSFFVLIYIYMHEGKRLTIFLSCYMLYQVNTLIIKIFENQSICRKKYKNSKK